MKKRRSDIARLISASRDAWRFSLNYHEAKANCRIAWRQGWYNCAICDRETEKPYVDHTVPIGKQPLMMQDFGAWLPRLFCSIDNLQAICSECHRDKTKKERQK